VGLPALGKVPALVRPPRVMVARSGRRTYRRPFMGGGKAV
jgi:hypothetical protein